VKYCRQDRYGARNGWKPDIVHLTGESLTLCRRTNICGFFLRGGIASEDRTVNLREFWREAVERRPRAVIQILTDVHQQSGCCILGSEQGGGRHRGCRRHLGLSLRGRHLRTSSLKKTSPGLPQLSRHV
jgi:hypothetical protein